MTLTPEDVNALKRAFPRADHEFINGYVYLTEQAVCDRIEEVDPAWIFEIQRLAREGDQTVCCARMTIKGVSREGVGMYRQTNPANEAEKSAATDAIKRCARLFSIGRYLLDNPPKEGKAFDEWLAQQQKALNGVARATPLPTTQPAPLQAPAPLSVSQNAIPASAVPNVLSSIPPTQSGAANGGSDEPLFPPLVEGAVVVPLNTEGDDQHLPRDVEGMPILGSLNMKAIGKLAQDEKLVKGRNHFANLIDVLWREGLIRAASKPEAVMEAIRKHESDKDMQREAVGK